MMSKKRLEEEQSEMLVGSRRVCDCIFCENEAWTNADTNRVLSHTIPNPIIERTVEEGHFSTLSEATHAAQEFLKYVALCCENPSTAIGMISAPVDEIWHSYILFTQEYFDFSRTVLRQEYFHHVPNIAGEGEGEQTVSNSAGPNFVRLYRQKFGPLPPIWGLLNKSLGCRSNEENQSIPVCGAAKLKPVCTSCTSCSSCGSNSCGNCSSHCNSGSELQNCNSCSCANRGCGVKCVTAS